MKKLIATVSAGAMLSLGGAGVAAAKDDSGGTKSDPTPTTQPQPDGRRQGEYREARRHVIRTAIEAAASTIGVDPKELIAAVRGGQTIGAFATSKGVDPQAVVAAVVAAVDAKIDQAVAAGKIPEARAAKAKQRVAELATRFVNELPKRLRPDQGSPSPT